MEEMEHAFSFVVNKLNITRPVKHSYNTNSNNISHSLYYKNISTMQIDLLRGIYKTDLQVFDYPDTPFG